MYNLLMMDIELVKNTASERASEGASEHNCMVRTPTVAKTEATKQKHNCWVRTPQTAKTETTKQKQQNRNNKTQHRIFILCHPLPFRSIVVCIGVRTLYLCRHLASVFAPCILPLQLAAGCCFSTAITRAVAACHGQAHIPP